MPRPNPSRDVLAERHLARRVAFERAAAGMSLEGLAKRMTDVGCRIHASAIYKIETADPPRRITVDELVGFSRVFGVPVEELLLPPEAAVSREVTRLLTEWNHAETALHEAQRHAGASLERLVSYIKDHPDSPLSAAVNTWCDELSDERDRNSLVMTLLSSVGGKGVGDDGRIHVNLDAVPPSLASALFTNLSPDLLRPLYDEITRGLKEHDALFGSNYSADLDGDIVAAKERLGLNG